MKKTISVFISLVLLLSSFSPVFSQLLVSVPIERLEGLLLKLKAYEVSLKDIELELLKSATKTDDLLNDIENLKNDIETWETKYQDLSTDWATLGTDYQDLQVKFDSLLEEFDKIVEDFSAFQMRLNRLSVKLKRNRTIAIVATIVVIVETFLLIDPFDWIP